MKIKNKILAMILIGCTLTMAKPTPSHAIITLAPGGASLLASMWWDGLMTTVGGVACVDMIDQVPFHDSWYFITAFVIMLDGKEGNSTPKFLAPNSQVIEEAHLLSNEVRSYTSEIPRLNENAAQVFAEASRLKQEGNDDQKIAQISYDRATELSQETLNPDAFSAFTKIRALMRARVESAAAALH
jgi:hypothetical protein